MIGARSIVEDRHARRERGFELERGAAVRGAAKPRLVDWPRIDETDSRGGGHGKATARIHAGGACHSSRVVSQGDRRRDVLCAAQQGCVACRRDAARRRAAYFCEVLDFHGPCVEFNVLESLWTSRVTSHVPLKDVSGLLTREAWPKGLLLTQGLQDQRMHAAGGVRSQPHNGDNGAFGREEIDTIGPSVSCAQRGFPADGPFPADTLRAAIRKDGQGYDGVLTMYHDQGQIAMKLMGFDRGVTVPGGLPIPIATPAHGTAYDIAGRGIANTGAMQNAFALACRMGGAASE